MVPVSISTSDNPSKPVKTVLLDKPTRTVTLENVKQGTWCKVNILNHFIFASNFFHDFSEKEKFARNKLPQKCLNSSVLA